MDNIIKIYREYILINRRYPLSDISGYVHIGNFLTFSSFHRFTFHRFIVSLLNDTRDT